MLLGVIFSMAITAILATFWNQKVMLEVEQSLTEGSGAYLSEVAGATEQFLFQNWYEYGNGIDIPGVANDLRPTIAELVVNSKRLLPSFPLAMPTRQSLEIFITRTNCPGPDCLLTALTCTTTPITFGRADTRFDLAAIMMTSQHGVGGQARQHDPSNIVGPSLSVPNPYGNTPGIVCASARVDTAIMMQMVRMGDTRNPYLRGNLTAAGDIGAGGDSGSACARAVLGANGRITSNRDDCKESVVINPDDSSLSAFDTANVKRAEINGLSGRVTANIFRPTASYAANSSCDTLVEGDIALDANTRFGLVVCRSGIWKRIGLESAVSGAACSPDGVVGQDSNGIAYICRGAKWQSMTGRLSRSVPFQRYLVVDGASIPIPTTCPADSVPAILIRGIDGLIDNTSSPSRNRFAHYAEKSGSNWIARLVVFDVNGARYSSSSSGTAYSMRAIAEVNCDFNN